MARSFKIQPHYIPDVKLALKLSLHSTQRALAQHLGFALVTISRFMNGQGVDAATFKAICQELQLDWQKFADLSPANRMITEAITTPPAPSAIDWGGYCHEAPFFGRSQELAQLNQWIQDSIQVISLLASGGTGKTALAYQCIQTLQPNFEFCLWRSLIYAPSLTDLLTDILLIYNPQFSLESLDRPEKLLRIFLDFLASHRCLIVLDNLESILQGGERLGHYRSGYEIYGQFLALIATAKHQSCILITSREPVPELVLKDIVNPKVETLQLSGLARTESQKILETQGEFQGSAEDWQRFLQRYGGNPLALKISAVGIREIFNGDIHQFLVSLDREPWSFDAIEQLLNRQIDRLSGSEQEVLYWLAIKHEPVRIDRLRDRILTPNTRNKLPEILRSLVGRGLTEKSGMKYALQPLVAEHVIQRLVNGFYQEFSGGQGQMLNSYVLLEAQAKDFIRDIQKRRLIAPLADRLSHDLGSLLQKQISALLQDFKHSSIAGYGPGNTINLMSYLGIGIDNYDFTGLPLWQADLRSVNLQGVNFAQCDLSQTVFHENFGVCTAVAFSPDRRLLATGDTNGEIHLWQLSNRQKLLTIAAHRTWIWSLVFSPDNETLASGGDDQVIKIWDRHTGYCQQTLQGHQGKVWALDYQSEGRYLMSASDRPQLKQWDLKAAICVNTWELPAGKTSIRAIAVSGKRLAIGGEDRVVSVWPVETADSPCLLVGHRDWIRSLAFDPTGEIIASGSEDGELRLWHWRDQTLLHTLPGHQKRIICLRMSPDGRLLASGSEDMTLKIWELESGRCLKTIHGHQSFIWSVAFSADSKILASGGGDYSIRLWQVNTGKCYYKLQGYSSWSPAMAIDARGRTLISGNDDGTIQRWQLSNPSQPQILGRHPQRVCAVAISPDDQLLATGGEEGGIQLWNLLSDGRCLLPTEPGPVGDHHCIGSWQAHQNSVWSLAFSPTDAHLASSGEDGSIYIWDWENHRCLYQLIGHDKWVAAIAYTTDGQTLLSGSHDHSIKVWDVTQQQCRLTFSGHQGWIWKLVLSPDDRFVASCSLDRTIKLWRLDNGECLQTLIGHRDIVWSVAFSPDGRQLASASSDLTVKVWDIATGECLQTFSGYSANLGTVLFSPNGDRLFCSNQDEIIKVWEMPSGKSLPPLRILKPYSGMNIQGVKGLTFQQQQTLYKLGGV
jgi:WD40 repeat protein/transcriptional regulator with XRE-family HTH domain